MKTIYEFLLKNKTTASTQDTDYVDLGLPSGLLWAKCNIGAEKPYEYGDYFMWGSTEPDTNKPCNWKHTPFNDGKTQFNDEYFESIKNKICPNNILAPEYDAATAILGNEWRLPTSDDFQELVDNTKQKWVKNYQDNGIDGILFQANDVDLFIPASGYRVVFSIFIKDNRAYLWSSSLNTSNPYFASCFTFNDYFCNMSDCYHFYGFCLRGVKK